MMNLPLGLITLITSATQELPHIILALPSCHHGMMPCLSSLPHRTNDPHAVSFLTSQRRCHCTRPKDQGRIDRARERFNAARRGSGGRTPAQSRCKTGPGGKPLILNENGHCVLDQRRWRSMQRANLAQHSSTPVVATPAPATPTRDNVSARVASRVDAVRAAAQATRVS